MKTNLLIVAMAVGFLTPAMAQFKPAYDDGIAASPKLRERLNEQTASASVPYTVITVDVARTARIGSPKFLDTWGTPAPVASLPVATKDYARRANCVARTVAGSPKSLETRSMATQPCCGVGPCLVACAR